MELVDREKLIAQYSANPETKGFMELIQDDCVVEALKKAEVIDAAPVVHGRWIEHEWAEEENGLLISNFECSNCHGWERKESDYCPNCGAKME